MVESITKTSPKLDWLVLAQRATVPRMMQHISRRSLLHLATAAAAAATPHKAARAGEGPVLLELFTSQGCSDCPPADALAGAFAASPHVQVLSFNVDYWDYLGWKDSLAKPQYSKRQMDYAAARGDHDVYTPQMVVGGSAHVIGSRRGDIEAAIAQVRADAAAPIAIRLNATGNDIEAQVSAGPGPAGTVWLMAVAPEIAVPIKRGENAGRSVTYHNVVRELVELGPWNGLAQNYRMPRSKLAGLESKFCVAVLQAGRVGPVLGFATLAI